jgi:nucleotide-binding universal stress UspA family protein
MASQQSSIKQILVALDGSPSSISALEKGVELAARLNAELMGLFVEDINLLRATQLPFAQEVSLLRSGVRRLEVLDLERQLRVQADRVRRIMERIGGAKKVPTIFRIVRGSVAEEILNAGKDADLLVLGKTGRSLPGFARSGSIVRSVLVRRPGMTLVWHAHGVDRRPVVLTYDGSESAGAALEVAVSLNEVLASGLIVYLVAKSREKGDALQIEVSKKLEKLGARAVFRMLMGPDFRNLAWMLKNENAGPVVLPCDKNCFSEEQLCSLVEEISNPVLLVK